MINDLRPNLIDGRTIAAQRALDMGEGDPAAWTALGLSGLPTALAAVRPISELVVACRAGSCDPAVGTVVAHPCIGRSGGRAAKLPVSVVWEAALALATAKALAVPASLTVCIYEETLQQPHRAGDFTALAEPLTCALERMAERADVGAEVSAALEPPRVPLPTGCDLYGLYTPYSSSSYPLGYPNEVAVLDAFAAYCARYHEATVRHERVWVAEGLHLAKAALIGLPPEATLLAMVPLPDPISPGQLLQDAPAGRRITLERFDQLPTDWWPESAIRQALGCGLRELAAQFAQDMGVTH